MSRTRFTFFSYSPFILNLSYSCISEYHTFSMPSFCLGKTGKNENLKMLMNFCFWTVVVQEVLKSTLRSNNSLERLWELSKSVDLQLWFITVKEHKLKFATGRDTQCGGQGRPGMKPAAIFSRCSCVDSTYSSQRWCVTTCTEYCQPQLLTRH